MLGKKFPRKTRIYKEASQHIMYLFSSKENQTCSMHRLDQAQKEPSCLEQRLLHVKHTLVLLNKCVANEAVTVRRKREALSL